MGDLQTCAVHGKNRAMRYLTEQGPGRFVCMVGYECKAAGSGAGNDLRVQCTLHGKLRSLDCLQDDGTGRLICTAERRCKTTGVSMPDRDMALVTNNLVFMVVRVATLAFHMGCRIHMLLLEQPGHMAAWELHSIARQTVLQLVGSAPERMVHMGLCLAYTRITAATQCSLLALFGRMVRCQLACQFLTGPRGLDQSAEWGVVGRSAVEARENDALQAVEVGGAGVGHGRGHVPGHHRTTIVDDDSFFIFFEQLAVPAAIWSLHEMFQKRGFVDFRVCSQGKMLSFRKR
eukprot:CAMPEP_0172719870 /NCGR_PEP_ID=MMETSP1074-20121228/75754_1 /TAXON_ID=2916 /ORGANISM="Ceratium fusus, Strain PA161109" /LENGTH=288 /DNA_ID=CAMNT_0013545269 /DNA_START=51 /DNA_END=915 /DNA_ORIENTATION=+